MFSSYYYIRIAFVFELSLASAADKKLSAKNRSAIFFWKYLGNCKKYVLRPMNSAIRFFYHRLPYSGLLTTGKNKNREKYGGILQNPPNYPGLNNPEYGSSAALFASTCTHQPSSKCQIITRKKYDESDWLDPTHRRSVRIVVTVEWCQKSGVKKVVSV